MPDPEPPSVCMFRSRAAFSSRTSGAAGRLAVVPANAVCWRSCCLAVVSGRCCTLLPVLRPVPSAKTPGAVLAGRPSAFQAGHIPVGVALAGRYVLLSVAAACRCHATLGLRRWRRASVVFSEDGREGSPAGLPFFVCDATVIRSGLAAALPSFSWPRWREGRAGCAEAPMVTVGVVAGVVERRLAAGRLRCPGCSGRLAGWGHARERVIRGEGGIGWRLRPRRSRCGGCGV